MGERYQIRDVAGMKVEILGHNLTLFYGKSNQKKKGSCWDGLRRLTCVKAWI
jgi:hypothetical protein